LKPEERKTALAAFGVLMTFMAGHALVEAARDALFLARIPASRLPWLYLAIAAATLVLAIPKRRRAGSSLVPWLLASSASALVFWPLARAATASSLYALYLWSGILTTVIGAKFWLLLGARFTVTQAKRLYPFIGSGSVLGALGGSGLSALLTTVAPTPVLLVATAVLFAASACFAAALEPASGSATPAEGNPAPLRHLLGEAYAQRIALIVVSSAITLTLADFIFKARVSEHIAAQDLGRFFAWFYFGLNALSLLVQLTVLPLAVRRLDVNGVAFVLPALMIVSAALVGATPALAGALLMKTVDGSLRYSLHRTSAELLYVPMSDETRRSAKTWIDGIGQRAAQAIGSLLILGALALGANAGWLAWATLAMAVAWALLALSVRRHYVGVFRKTLREAAYKPRVALPDMDLASLESVMVALNSRTDGEVIAALRLLDQSGRARVIPGLILYHPDPNVVDEAIAIFTRTERHDVVPVLDRVLAQSSVAVRTSALRARLKLSPELAVAERFTTDDAPQVRATAYVFAVSLGSATADYRRALQELVVAGDSSTRLALLEAVIQRPSPVLEELVLALASAADEAVVRAALRAMACVPSMRYLPLLIRLLSGREFRRPARATLVALGDMAFSYLETVLADEEKPLSQRRHVPRTLMRFAPERAARALVARLPHEPDGIVKYKILRALTQLRKDDPGLPLDRAIVEAACIDTVAAIRRLLGWKLHLNDAARADPTLATRAHGLLVRLLADKEVHAIDRLFLILSLLQTKEDIAAIVHGLRSPDPKLRASSRELLGYVLQGPLRPLVSLVDDAPDRERLLGSGERVVDMPYEELLSALVSSGSDSIAALAAYHANELDLGRATRAAEKALAPSSRRLLAQLPTFKLVPEPS
jgi:AAA family ATP:ADP antiporter